ncbi:MAG: redox-regulated ATPase YchF [Chloroflexota bacterium]|nr:redox-regulated ATPase YchF [Chloroflexota bacterium]
MELGIIGLPQSGKTTLFNALTRGDVPTGISGGKMEVHTAVIDVPDVRVEKLNEIFKPKKTVYAKVTYADVAGLEGKAAEGGISGPLLNTLSQMDGFIHVVRQFENPSVPHMDGNVDPQRDLANMETELILNDLILVERKLERLEEESKRGGVGRDKGLVARETALFERLQALLAEEIPLRNETYTEDEEKMLSSYGFLSRKPQLIVINHSEEQTPIEVETPYAHTQVVNIPAKLEMDIAQLPPDEAELFLAEYGIEEPSLNRFIRLSYDLLGLQSFFTAGEKEVHAWTVARGATAPEAAGVIHSDMEKGFIRAEVVSFDDLVNLGSFAEARNQGRLRLEGKKYIIEDGDVIEIRFNV